MSDQQKKVLVADDDPGILDMIQLVLEDAGYVVVTSMDGGVDKLLKLSKPNIILLDIWMSGVDGRDICRHLKSEHETKHIPVIMISANKDTEQIARAAGADDFIHKPFDIRVLIQKVGNLTQ